MISRYRIIYLFTAESRTFSALTLNMNVHLPLFFVKNFKKTYFRKFMTFKTKILLEIDIVKTFNSIEFSNEKKLLKWNYTILSLSRRLRAGQMHFESLHKNMIKIANIF